MFIRKRPINMTAAILLVMFLEYFLMNMTSINIISYAIDHRALLT